jgi:hypothetical protein
MTEMTAAHIASTIFFISILALSLSSIALTLKGRN